mmetsp:Transcript_13498/g.50254  ORF Transcript_13498/g.50254 Transcript_13498/m.50254 type:complete len:285 (-) Transcript_13498:47-901(-)
MLRPCRRHRRPLAGDQQASSGASFPIIRVGALAVLLKLDDLKVLQPRDAQALKTDRSGIRPGRIDADGKYIALDERSRPCKVRLQSVRQRLARVGADASFGGHWSRRGPPDGSRLGRQHRRDDRCGRVERPSSSLQLQLYHQRRLVVCVQRKAQIRPQHRRHEDFSSRVSLRLIVPLRSWRLFGSCALLEIAQVHQLSCMLPRAILCPTRQRNGDPGVRKSSQLRENSASDSNQDRNIRTRICRCGAKEEFSGRPKGGGNSEWPPRRRSAERRRHQQPRRFHIV